MLAQAEDFISVQSNARGFSSEAAGIGEQLSRPSTSLICKVQGSVRLSTL